MKSKSHFVLASVLGSSVLPLGAQESNQVEQLRKQLQELRQSHQNDLEQQRQRIEALQERIANLDPAQSAAPAQRWSPSQPITLGRGSAYMNVGMVATFAAGGSSANDIEGGTQPGGHDPNQRGFTVQGAELNLNGAVDPYFRGNLNVSYQLDSGGESFLELEEAWLETLSLPLSLQARAGQLLTDFGRINPTHLHTWAFVDAPLVNARFLGPDGLRNPGAAVSWLMPTPFYSVLSLSAQNSHGETATSFRSAGAHHHGGEEENEEALPLGFRHPDNDRGVSGIDDLLFAPRFATSFDLTDNQVLLAGASAVFGPNSSGQSGDTDTQIYGLDLTWKWKSPRHHGGFPFVSFQTEGMLRRYEGGAFDWDEDGNGGDGDGDGFVDEGILTDPGTGLPAMLSSERLTDYGFYGQLLYGFRKGWVAGLRYDYVDGKRGDYEQAGFTVADGAGAGDPVGPDLLRARRHRISPNLTWYPSEYSKIRLQYNFDDRRGIGRDHSVWLQFEFLLGAHAAHTF